MISIQSVSSSLTVLSHDDPLHIHLGRRLGEGEERRAEADLRPGPPETPRELGQRGLEVHEGDPLVHDQPLDLREGGGVRRVVGVPAVHHPGRDDADRRRMELHGTDLHRRRVAAQQQPRRQVQRVLLVGCRMVERRVEGDEVVPLGVHLGSARTGEAQAAKDGADVVDDLADRVHGAAPPAARGQGQVESGGPLRPLGRGELAQTFLERFRESLLRLVGGRARRWPLRRVQGAEAAQQPRDEAIPATQVADADPLKFIRILAPCEPLCKGVALQLA